MALNQKRSNKEGTAKEHFLVPEDSYVAKLYSVIDLGEHDSGFRKIDKITGKDHGPVVNTKMHLTFELQDVNLEDGRPAVVSRELTASLSDLSNFLPIAHALLGGTSESLQWLKEDGREIGDVLEKILGKAGLLTIVHSTSKKNGKVYANIGSVAALPKAMHKSVTPTVNSLVSILDVNNVSEESIEKLPRFLLDKMANRLNKPEGDSIEDIPF